VKDTNSISQWYSRL